MSYRHIPLRNIASTKSQRDHQAIENPRHILQAKIAVEWRLRGESVARERRDDNVIWQRLGGVRVSQTVHDGEELEKASCIVIT